MLSRRAIQFFSLFLFLAFVGSVVNVYAIPQSEQTSTTSKKRSKKKKSQEAAPEQATGSRTSKLDLNTAPKQELSTRFGSHLWAPQQCRE